MLDMAVDDLPPTLDGAELGKALSRTGLPSFVSVSPSFLRDNMPEIIARPSFAALPARSGQHDHHGKSVIG